MSRKLYFVVDEVPRKPGYLALTIPLTLEALEGLLAAGEYFREIRKSRSDVLDLTVSREGVVGAVFLPDVVSRKDAFDEPSDVFSDDDSADARWTVGAVPMAVFEPRLTISESPADASLTFDLSAKVADPDDGLRELIRGPSVPESWIRDYLAAIPADEGPRDRRDG